MEQRNDRRVHLVGAFGDVKPDELCGVARAMTQGGGGALAIWRLVRTPHAACSICAWLLMAWRVNGPTVPSGVSLLRP